MMRKQLKRLEKLEAKYPPPDVKEDLFALFEWLTVAELNEFDSLLGPDDQSGAFFASEEALATARILLSRAEQRRATGQNPANFR